MRRQGDAFLFLRVSTSLSCGAMTASFAAMVSFLAATVALSASCLALSRFVQLGENG